MSWKSFTLNFIWFWVSILCISLFSTQDKEWFIDGNGINNICDLMIYIENDDIRPIGVAMTIPVFFPFIYAMTYKKQRSGWQYSVVVAVALFWVWCFFLRYQLCW